MRGNFPFVIFYKFKPLCILLIYLQAVVTHYVILLLLVEEIIGCFEKAHEISSMTMYNVFVFILYIYDVWRSCVVILFSLLCEEP